MVSVSDEIRPRMHELHQTMADGAMLFSPKFTSNLVLQDGTPAIWIPRTITDATGGRPSVYDLKINTKTLMGLFATGSALYSQYLTRINDDEYSVSIESAGKVVYSGTGKITVVNEQVGYGMIQYQGEAGNGPWIGPEATDVWVGWSCVKVHTE